MARSCHGCGDVGKCRGGKDPESSRPSFIRPGKDPDDCFEAARRGYTIRLTCWACGHHSVLHPAGLWWHFHKQGRPDTFRILRQRARCRPCYEKRRRLITSPVLQLVHDEVTAEP